MARTTHKPAALAPVAEPVDVTDAMFEAVAAFIAEHFPRSNAAAIVVNVAHGLPPVIIPVGHTGDVPAIIGDCSDHPRRN